MADEDGVREPLQDALRKTRPVVVAVHDSGGPCEKSPRTISAKALNFSASHIGTPTVFQIHIKLTIKINGDTFALRE